MYKQADKTYKLIIVVFISCRFIYAVSKIEIVIQFSNEKEALHIPTFL